MVKSIRARLQLWYGLVLIAIVASFAFILYLRASAAAFREIDAKLEAAAAHLDVALRGLPRQELEHDGSEPSPPHPKKGYSDGPEFDKDDWGPGFPPPKKGFRKEPPRRDRERLLAELELPPEMDSIGDSGERIYYAIWRADGSLLKSTTLPDGARWPNNDSTAEIVRPRLTPRESFHEAVMLGPHSSRILVGRSVARQNAELRSFAWQLAGVGFGVVALGLLGGWFISSRIVRPIAAMAATASSISVANLGQRIDTSRIDRELADLANVLNAAFDRLQRAFERQHEFTADASHELRTPLAIIRSNAQLALDRPRSAEDYRQAVETCLRSADRMTTIVEGLLALARADAGWPGAARKRFDFKDLVIDCITFFRPLAENKGVIISDELDSAQVEGDPSALSQLVGNLLSNSIHYNRPDGTVRVRLVVESNVVLLTVTDSGEGIPEADRSHLFERFYRVDKARSRSTGGTGLGLAICKSIVEAHHGTIGFESDMDRGTTFWVRLPRAGSAD